MRTARRHAANREDAEDAFQRGFEILLTSAPDLREDELVPWLKTVVKHEAYAITRARARHAPITDDGGPVEQLTAVAVTHDHVESRERGLQGAEALARLKPQEVRALVLKARGLSYREIGELEDWSYTKVNRLLTEGRRAFRRRLAGIHAGAECERMEPLLSLLADGEANGEQVATLRPHLKTCLSCRARLRDFRSAPHDVAALAPAVGGGDGGRVRTLIEGVLGVAQGKSAALAEKAHALTELATSQKLAAVAASAVAVAGGGAAAEEVVTHSPPPPTAVVEPQQRADALAMKEEVPIQAVPQAEEPAASNESESAASAPADTVTTEQPAAEPRPDPANEFDPSGAAAAVAVERDSEPGDTSLGAVAPSPPPVAPAPVGGGPGEAAGGAAPGGASPPGSSEFAP